MAIQGIIRPPPAIRAVADKTALFVAKNGRAFENKIINSEKGRTPKFAFLHPTSHFHAYYEDRILFYQDGGTNADKGDKNKSEDVKKDDKGADASEKEGANKDEKDETKVVSAAVAKSRQTKSIVDPVARALLKQRTYIQKASQVSDSKKEKSTETIETAETPTSQLIPPPSLYYTTLLPPKAIPTAQLEILQFTAQVVALQGRGGSFLRDLSHREWDNPTQWGFLQPRHAHFSYFSNLVDVYKRILGKHVLGREQTWKGSLLEMQALKTRVGLDLNEVAEDDIGMEQKVGQEATFTQELRREQRNMKYMAEGVGKCLEKVAYAAEYDLHIEEKRRKQQENLEDDRSGTLGGSARVDWHDFVVVETIDFPVDEIVERLPPPPTSTMKEIEPKESQVEEEEEAMDESSDDEDGDEEKIKVVSDYAPKVVSSEARFSSDARTHVIDPITKKRIALEDTSDHMRIQLMDPEWAKQQKIFKEKQKESNYVQGDMIARNVNAFAKARGDLFGKSAAQITTHEEEAKKRLEEANRLINEQKQLPQLQPIDPSQGQPSVLISQGQSDYSASSVHQKPELTLPEPKRMRADDAAYTTTATEPAPLTSHESTTMPPPPSGMKNNDETLTTTLSEADFCDSLLDRNIPLTINVPNDPSNVSWNFKGQTLSITLDAMSVIKNVKQKIQSQLGMPVNKMQLKSPNTGFLKDGLTLAFLNIGPDHGALELVPKVRGRGRK